MQPIVNVSTIHNPEFIDIHSVSPLISKCNIKILYVGENRNRSIITKEVATQMAQTLGGVPIVGQYIDNKEDFGDHGEQVIIDAEGIKFNTLTKPYGFVPTNTKVWFQEFEEQTELGEPVTRLYLMCEGYLWTQQYQEALKVIEEGRPQSMELDEKSLQGAWTKPDNRGIEFFIISDAIFSKLCILGEDVEPCFEGATIAAPESSFTLDKDFTTTLYTMMKQLKEFITQGGESVENKDKVSETVPEEAPASFAQEQVAEPPQTPAPEFKKDDSEEEKEKEEETKEEKEDDEDEDEKKPKASHTLDSSSIVDTPEYQKLAVEFTKLQNKYQLLEAEIASLRNFKNDVEDEKKTELINSFYMLSDEDKQDVIANKTKYTLDEIEAKLSVICVRKKVNFNLDEKEPAAEEKEEPAITFSLAATENSEVPAWLKAVDQYKLSK